MASRPLLNASSQSTRKVRIGFADSSAHLWPAIIISYAAVLPQELTIYLGGAALFPYRLALLAMVPWLLGIFFSRPIRPNIIDVVAGLVTAWLLIATIVNEPIARALEYGSAHAIDFGIAYFAGRVAFRNTRDFKRYFVAMLPLLAGLAALMMVESLLHRHILRPAIAQILDDPPPVIHQQIRLGLYRAAGPFPHPILGGVFLASCLPLAIYATDRMIWRVIGIAIACSMIFTVSSTAILGFACGLALIVLFWLQKTTRGPVLILTAVAVAMVFMLISVVSEGGPFTFAIYRFTLDPTSGYWRLLIWEYAGAEALNNPIFGIGLRDWFRPPFMVTPSIDAHFLLWSMRFGLPAGVGCLVVFAGSAFYLLRNLSAQSPAAQPVSLGLAICLITIAFSGFSVAFWGGLAAWSYMLCGAAIAIGTPKGVAPPTPPNQALGQERHAGGSAGTPR